MGQGPPSSRRLRVLIVEDYDDARDSLCLLVGLWGYSCRTAADGPSALQAATDFLPDVVLMDIGLPKMDGYKVARAMRELPGMSGAVFVAVTGYSRLPAWVGPADDIFLTYMVKPVEPDELRELLNLVSVQRGTPPTGAGAADAINLAPSPC